MHLAYCVKYGANLGKKNKVRYTVTVIKSNSFYLRPASRPSYGSPFPSHELLHLLHSKIQINQDSHSFYQT